MFNQLFPVIAVADMARARHFYQELLGGRPATWFDGPDGQPTYMSLDIGASHIGLNRAAPDAPAASDPRPVSFFVYVDDCDAAMDRLAAAGVPVLEAATTSSWGGRVGRVRDPDGNEVMIGGPWDKSTARPPQEG